MNIGTFTAATCAFLDNVRKTMRPLTLVGYADTFGQLFDFAERELKCTRFEFDIEDFDAEFIEAFLDYLATANTRGGKKRSGSTINTRLAAIKACFRYIGAVSVVHAHHCARVCSISKRRHEIRELSYITVDEWVVLQSQPNPATYAGQRDRLLMHLAFMGGLRASEVLGIRRDDLNMLAPVPFVSVSGKGGRTRKVPISEITLPLLKSWLDDNPGLGNTFIFRGYHEHKPMTRDALLKLVKRYIARAAGQCSSLAGKNITTHTLRHGTVMGIVQTGQSHILTSVFMGHKDPKSINAYIHADLEQKKRTLARLQSAVAGERRFGPSEISGEMLDFLTNLNNRKTSRNRLTPL